MRFYYPNRPTLIPPDPDDPLNPKPDFIRGLEKQGRFIAEQKWNGDNVMIFTDDLSFWNRKKEPMRYVPTKEVAEELKRWPKQSVLNAELVHYKTKTIKNLIIIHCVMAWEGEYLLGETWGDSRYILEMAEKQGLPGDHVKVSPVWQSGFWELFKAADGTIIEGIVLKDPSGKLVYSASSQPRDVPWMKKIRKPCKKYSF